MASQKGHVDIVKALIEAGGNVNQHSNKNQTPLNIASTAGHTEIVRLLLQQPNIDLNKIDDWNTTALGIDYCKRITTTQISFNFLRMPVRNRIQNSRQTVDVIHTSIQIFQLFQKT